MARIHGRGRLCDAVVVALRRLGDGRGGGLERAWLLAQARWRVVLPHARRAASGRSGRGGLARGVLPGGRPPARGRQAICRPGGKGRGGARPTPPLWIRARVGGGAPRRIL